MAHDPRSTARWRRIRELVLNDQPLCTDPFLLHAGRPACAVEVDHIVPVNMSDEGWFDLENLQGLCRICHARKSGIERRRGGDNDNG